MVAGLIDALHFAHPDDASAVLHGIGDAQVAEGIAQASLPLCVAVSDFVLGQPPSAAAAAAVALARRALADETVADPDAVLRALLRLADPAVDEVLVRTVGKRSRAWILAALVRDRRGPEGRPIIAPGVKRFLRNQLARAERRHADRHSPMPARIETDLTVAACSADDIGLATTALPLAIHLRQVAAAVRGLRTLRDAGLLADVWEDELRERVTTVMAAGASYYAPWWETVLAFGDTGDDAELDKAPRPLRTAGLPPAEEADSWTAPNIGSQHYAMPWDAVLAYASVVGTGEEWTQAGQATSRGLDEAAAREDVPQDVRELFEARYPRAVFWAARPDVETLRRARGAVGALNPAMRHFATRELLRRGLLHGSLSAAEAVAHAAPAADVLALALPTPPGLAEYYTAKGKNSFAPHFVTIPEQAEERYRAELRAAVAEAIGPDAGRWLRVLTRVAAWEGSLAGPGGLPAAVDAGVPLPARRAGRWPRGVDPAAVLLEVAPAEVVAALVEAAGFGAAEEHAAAEPAALDGAEARAGIDRSTAEPVRSSDLNRRLETEAQESSGPEASALAGPDRRPVAEPVRSSDLNRRPETEPQGTSGPEASALADPDRQPVAEPVRSSDPEVRALIGVLTRILDRGPEPRWLLDLALGPHGTPAMRLAAARNPAASVGTLWRLADREPAEPGVLAAVYLHPLASLELRIAAVVRSEAVGGIYPALVQRLVTRYAEPALLQPALESHDPELLHAVLRRSNRSLQTDRRIVAYARLAAAAGPEPVWALELERAGSLEKMHEAVRASMSEHSDEPLRAAATGIARPDPERVTALWDAGFQPTRPNTADLVRRHLDGRPERWMRLAEDGVTLHGLLAEFESIEAITSEGADQHLPQPRQSSDTPALPAPVQAPREPKPRLSQTPSLLPPLPRSEPPKPPTP